MNNMHGPYDLSYGNAGVRAMTDRNRRVILDHAEFLRAEARAYDPFRLESQQRYALAKKLDGRANKGNN